MKAVWEIDKIKDCISDGDEELLAYCNISSKWEDMYRLDAYTQDEEDEAKDKGRVLDVSTFPRANVRLATGMILDKPVITVPCNDAGLEEDARARERFLTHIWEQQGMWQEAPPLADLAYSSIVLGRAAAKVTWLGPDYDMPIRIEAIRPENVYIHHDTYGKAWAYHKYETDIADLQSSYPKIKSLESMDHKEIVHVYDFWYRAGQKIYNAVLMSTFFSGGNDLMSVSMGGDTDEFLIKPKLKKDYNDIPIFLEMADIEFSKEPHLRGHGINSGLGTTWTNANHAATLEATAMHRDYWKMPYIVPEGKVSPGFKFNMGFGAPNILDPGMKISTLDTSPNIGLAQSVQARSSMDVQKMTFPDVLFGAGGDQISSGFSVTTLQQQAFGRMNGIVSCLKRMIVNVNATTLCLVDKFALPKGIELWGDPGDGINDPIEASLKPSQVNGRYTSFATVSISISGDQMQRVAMALQEVQTGLMSKDTYRRRFKALGFAYDEEAKMIAEMVASDPDYIRAVAVEIFAKRGIQIPEGEPNGRDDQDQFTQAMQAAQIEQAVQSLQAPQQVPGVPVPNALQGQITPQQLGLDQQGDAAQFQAATGRPLTLQELAQLEAGEGGQR